MCGTLSDKVFKKICKILCQNMNNFSSLMYCANYKCMILHATLANHIAYGSKTQYIHFLMACIVFLYFINNVGPGANNA